MYIDTQFHAELHYVVSEKLAKCQMALNIKVTSRLSACQDALWRTVQPRIYIFYRPSEYTAAAACAAPTAVTNRRCDVV